MGIGGNFASVIKFVLNVMVQVKETVVLRPMVKSIRMFVINAREGRW